MKTRQQYNQSFKNNFRQIIIYYYRIPADR